MIEVIYGVGIGQEFNGLFREPSEPCWGPCVYLFFTLAEWACSSIVIVFSFVCEIVFYFTVFIAYIACYYECTWFRFCFMYESVDVIAMSVEDIVDIIFCIETVLDSSISSVIYFIVVEVSVEEEEDISICYACMVIEIERSFIEGTFSLIFYIKEIGEEVD